jgi:DNA-binding MarR family transcriptional regulator
MRATPEGANPDDALDQLFELSGVLAEYMERDLSARRLTRARAEVVWRLSRCGPVTQRELSQQLRVTPRNVTALLDALEAGGFVIRMPHPSDRRATLVGLTEHGSDTAAALHEDHRRFSGQLFGDVSREDLTRFVTAVARVLARVRELAELPQPPNEVPGVRSDPTNEV